MLRTFGKLLTTVSVFFIALGLAQSAKAYSYNSYEVDDLTVTHSSTAAGETDNITISFTIPDDMTAGLSTSGYISLSTPYLYTYRNGSYSYSYVDISSATISSSQLTISYQGSSYFSAYPKSSLAAGSTVTITINGARNPSDIEGTGSFSIYGYEYSSSADTYNYFWTSASQVYGTADLTVTMYTSDGTTPVRNVYIGLSYYNSGNWSDYEYHYGYTNSAGQVQFAGLTTDRSYSLSFSYSGTATDDDPPSGATLTYNGGNPQSASYNFITSNVTTHFHDRDNQPINNAYWYFYKTDYSNYYTDYVWRWGYTNSVGEIKGAAQVDGSYRLYAYYNNNYYSYDFTVSNGVVSGLPDPITVPSPEISGTVYAGSSVASNVYIYVHNRDWTTSQYVYTDSNGYFEVALGKSDEFKLEISAYTLPSGYFPADPVNIDVTANTAGSPLTINLKQATKTISGKVTKQESSAAGVRAGTPVTDATIYAYQMAGNYAFASVSSNGDFSLPVIGNSWNLYIYQQSWPATWAYTGDNVVVTFNDDSTTETATVNWSVLPYDAHIKLRAVFPDGTPVTASSVYCYAYGGANNRVYSYAYTDSNGLCDLRTTAGTYSLYLYFYSSSGSGNYSAPTLSPQTVEAGKTVDLGDVALVEKNSTIEGSISIRDTGEAVPNHYIYAYKRDGSWDWASATTDSNGFYSLKLAPGEWTINTYTWGLQTASGKKVIYTGTGLAVTVAANETVSRQDFIFDVADAKFSFIVEDKDGNEMTDETGWVNAHETDDSDSYGWYGIGCYVQKGTCSLDVSSDKEYEIDYYSYRNWYWNKDEDDTYSLSHIEVDGVQTDKASAAADETQEVVLVMSKNDATISGQFLDQDGNPTKVQAYVYASSENQQWVSTYVDKENNYSLKVGPGVWRVSYWTYGNWMSMYNNTVKVEAESGKTVTADFTVLETNATISGTVLDTNGNAVTTPTFVKASTVYGETETATGEKYGLVEQTTYTNDQGKFNVEVPSGSYYVTASSPDYLAPQPLLVTADNAGSAENLQLKFLDGENTISGNVLDGIGISINAHRVQAIGDTMAGAFVYGYCAKGSYTTTESDSAGAYSLSVSNKDTCFIGAIYQAGTTAYYSDRTLVKVKREPVTQDITLNHSLTLPAAQTAKFDPAVITMEDGATVEIPANSITTDSSITEVTVTVTPVVKTVHQPGLAPLTYSYELTATDQNGNPITQFASDVKITIPYNENDASAVDSDESSLQVGYYEDAANSWQAVDGGVVMNKQDNKFEISVDHFSNFGVLASGSIVANDDEEETDEDENGGDENGDEDGTNQADDELIQEGVLTAPANLRVIDRSTRSLTVKWNKVGSASAYKVRVTTGKKDKVVKQQRVTKRTVILKNLTNNQSYTVTVRSIGSTGSKSGWSEPLVVRTKPMAPTNLQATQVTNTAALLRWKDVRGHVQQYVVTVFDASGKVIQQLTGKRPYLSVTNLHPGTTYSFTVKAKASKLDISTASASATFQTTK